MTITICSVLTLKKLLKPWYNQIVMLKNIGYNKKMCTFLYIIDYNLCRRGILVGMYSCEKLIWKWEASGHQNGRSQLNQGKYIARPNNKCHKLCKHVFSFRNNLRIFLVLQHSTIGWFLMFLKWDQSGRHHIYVLKKLHEIKHHLGEVC